MIHELAVHATVPKHPGVSTVVRTVKVDGSEFLDIRDLVAVDGENTWGRGYMIPLSPEAIAAVAEGLLRAAQDAP